MTGELAYVFWHWPAPGVDIAAYEQALVRFHGALREDDPPGFRSSEAFRVGELPWTPQPAYEDWYLVDDFGALGRLNDAAVDRARSGPHDTVASHARGGVGGIYRLQRGAPRSGEAVASWLSKPLGMGYARFDALLAMSLPDGSAAWRRQMVLGPAPEFCVHSRSALTLPADSGKPLRVSRKRVI